MPASEERTDRMERRQVYPAQRTPRRRRRRRRCADAGRSPVRDMWHLVEPNDHDRPARRRPRAPSGLLALLLGALLVAPSSALSPAAFRSLDAGPSHQRLARAAHETGDAYRPLREKESNVASVDRFTRSSASRRPIGRGSRRLENRTSTSLSLALSLSACRGETVTRASSS